MAFTDFIQLQRDVAHALLSDSFLANVNIMTREEIVDGGSKLEDQNLAAETLVYLTPRNNKQGLGIIVEKPEFQAINPNVEGPPGNLVITCLVLEDWAENYAPDGTAIPSDQAAQKVLDLLHIWTVQGLGIVYADSNAIAPARDWEPLRAYRVRVRISHNRGQTSRVLPVIIGSAAQLSLTCATAGAAIYYTTDGLSTPAPSNVVPHGNSQALLYVAPGPVLDATATIRAAAFKAGMIQSPIARKTVTVP